jgi:hypothetical protein
MTLYIYVHVYAICIPWLSVLNNWTFNSGKSWYKWLVTWRHAISHLLGRSLLYVSLRVIKLQPRFKVCNISYLRASFHGSQLLRTFWYINHKKIKGIECIHVTNKFYLRCFIVNYCLVVGISNYQYSCWLLLPLVGPRFA